MTIYTSILLDENTSYTLQELSDLCNQSAELILEIMEVMQGILELSSQEEAYDDGHNTSR